MSYGRTLAQCDYKDYEIFISRTCEGCNQSQMSNFLFKKCQEADSMLMNGRERFHNKIIKQFNGSKTEKDQIEQTYNRSFEALVKTRDIVFQNYDSLTGHGDNRYYTQLFYWYYTDKATEILKDMESTIFGD